MSKPNLRQDVVEPTISLFDWLKNNLLDFSTGTIVAIVITVALLYARRRGRKALKRHPNKRSIAGITGAMLANISWPFVVASALKIITIFAPLHEVIVQAVNQLFVIVLPFQIAIWIRDFVMGLVSSRTTSHDGEDLSNALSVIRFIVNLTVFSVASILALDNLGVNVSALLAGLGIGGIAIGLAAKGVFSDLFAALSILFDKPFKRGDSILYDDTDATVERIGMMTTRLRSKYGQEIIISNENLLEKEIINEADVKDQRDVVRFSLSFETPTEKLRHLHRWMAEELEKIDLMKLHRAAIRDIVSNIIQYEVIFWVHSSSSGEVARKKSEFIIAMLDRLEREGIRLANPVRIDLVETDNAAAQKIARDKPKRGLDRTDD